MLFFASATPALRASTVAENTDGTQLNGFAFYDGQSFTTTNLTPANNITFNFFSDSPATTPAAFGTGFLLSMEYLGTPDALSAATPGFLGMATASGGFYTFASSLTLSPGVQYWVYENALIPLSAVSGEVSGGGGNLYSGGHGYFSTSASGAFAGFTSSNNFRVTSAVPESGTSGLLLLGIIVLFAARKANAHAQNVKYRRLF
jgi:hypothetical protein